MSTKAGALLWNRRRIDVPAGVPIPFDTGLTQVNKGFDSMSPNEPPLGVTTAVVPPPGALPASRVQVVPLSPISKWASITHSEPYFNPVTGTVFVNFASLFEVSVTDLNVLFWDPHSIAGPGQAAPYNDAV